MLAQGSHLAQGLRLALSWLTVLPVRVETVTPPTCRSAIALAPVVGGLVGGAGVLVMGGLTAASAPASTAGLVTVGALVLLTRGMHVDGLADSVDALGCYGPPERALAVMRDSSTGPFAVVALILTVGTQATAFAELASAGHWAALAVSCAAGRAGFALCCHRSVPAARTDGLGAMVASSQPSWIVVGWGVVLAGLAAVAVPATWWVGPIAVATAALALLAFVRHVRRRFGGITGDVLGASSEIATTVTLAVFTLA